MPIFQKIVTVGDRDKKSAQVFTNEKFKLDSHLHLGSDSNSFWAYVSLS